MERVRILPATLAGLYATHTVSARSYPRHWHDGYGIGLIDAGAQRSASGRGQVHATAGDLITVNPAEVHDGEALGGQARQWRMLYLEPALMQQLAQDLGVPAAQRLELSRPVLSDPQLAQRFARVFEALAAAEHEQNSLVSETELQELLAALLASYANQTPREVKTLGFAAMEQVRARLADQSDLTPSLAELADLAGLSRFQLLRSFKRAYGLPPHSYLLQCRLAQARRQIAQGQGLVEVALSCGFADQSHLTRAFQRFLGLTPGAYRQAQGGNRR
ncbi:AraC family transcriptional regulator [Paucibacter sp. AS339]|uniref:AraC family transcriptional regulator n=1 Tax=Paucibacter hankyongi TaxID=3133434 RepID=UPI00309B1ED5